MLYNDYRPQTFSEVVGQKEVIENLMAQSARDRFFGVYILCGQFGSGKTTTARIIAMAANCQHKDENGNPCGVCEDCRSIRDGVAPDVQEIAAAVSTGVDKVREICDTVAYLPVALKKKVYIIDEVQALSKAAFQAFLKMLEEPPKHAIFILATTDVGAIPPTVRSRAATYYFKQLTQMEISGHIRNVSDMEKLSVTEDACAVIAKYSQGSMRNALSLLDIATQDGKLATGEKVEKLLGVSTPDAVFAIIREVLAGNAGNIVTKLNALAEGGADLSVLISDMLNTVSDLTVASVSLESVRGTEHYLSLIRETVVHGSSVRFTAIADELFKVKQIMNRAPELSMLIVSLVRLSRRSDVVEYGEAPGEDVTTLRNTVSMLEAKLRELEDRISSGVVVPVPVNEIEQEVTLPLEESIEEFDREAVPVENAFDEKVDEPADAEPVSGLEEKSEIPESVCEELAADEPAEHIVKEQAVSVMEEAKAETASAKSVDDYYTNFFFGGEDETTVDEQQINDASVARTNQQKLEEDSVYRAVMSCCDVTEKGESVVIVSEFPVAKRFTNILLAAYERRGYDITGIKVS